MKKIIKELSVGLLTFSPFLAMAQYQQPPSSLQRLIETITNYAIGIIIAIAVLYILWGAFKFLTSQGGDGVKEGRDTIIYALVAVGVALLARILVRIVVEIIPQF
ncbi:MAG: hypothetical protein AAB847_02420 [Patescibacteria group bacterium]